VHATTRACRGNAVDTLKNTQKSATLQLLKAESTISLPHLTTADGLLHRSSYQDFLWKASSSLLREHEHKLPFLKLPTPSSKSHPIKLEHEEMERAVKMSACSSNRQFSSCLTSTNGARRFLTTGDGKSTSTHADRKHRQQAALAADRRYVKEMLAKSIEKHKEEEAREKAMGDDSWELFAPVPSALRLLPAIYQDSSLYETSQHAHSTVVVHETPPLIHEEMEEVLRVCCRFHGLVCPRTAQDTFICPAVLGRASFCRLICAMGGISAGAGECPQLIRAVRHFDRLATEISVKGCPHPAGSIVGFLLQVKSADSMSMPMLHELSIHQLFGHILRDMVERQLQKGRAVYEECLAQQRQCLFKVLLVQAGQYACNRAADLQQQVEDVREQFARTSAQLADQHGEETDAPEALFLAIPGGGGGAAPNVLGRGRSQDSNHHTSTKHKGADAVHHREGTDTLTGSVYAQTCAVLKGEHLASQLLEPECLHLMAEFTNVFTCIFNSYSDVPVSTTQRHMTFTSFLMCAADFGLFPSKVDFQTIQWIYNNAQCASEPSRPKPASSCPSEGSIKHSDSSLSQSTTGTHIVTRQKSGRFCNAIPKTHLSWLTKKLQDLTDDELDCCCLLRTVNDWLVLRNLKVRDFFAFSHNDGRGHIKPDEFVTAVKFMNFKNAPSAGQLRQMYAMLTSPLREDLDIATLHFAAMSASKFGKQLDEQYPELCSCSSPNYAVKHPLLLCVVHQQNTTKQKRRIFHKHAFKECLLKVALWHLNYHGTPAQAEQQSFHKVLWLFAYMHWQFRLAKNHFHQDTRAPQTQKPQLQSPLYKLLESNAELFTCTPEGTMPAFLTSRGPLCSSCFVMMPSGFGSALCQECCLADIRLQACLQHGPPKASGAFSLDRLLLSAGDAS